MKERDNFKNISNLQHLGAVKITDINDFTAKLGD
jgi:hypothetical protein